MRAGGTRRLSSVIMLKEMKAKGKTREDLPWSPFSGSSLAMVATVSGTIDNS